MASKKRPSISRAKPRKDTRSAKDILRTGSEGEPDTTATLTSANDLVLIRAALTMLDTKLDRIDHRTVEVEKEVRALRGYKDRPLASSANGGNVTPLGQVKQDAPPAKVVEEPSQLPLPGVGPGQEEVRKLVLDLQAQGKREVIQKAFGFLGVKKVSELAPGEECARAIELLTVKAEA